MRSDPLSLLPALVVIAGNMPYNSQLRDFIPRRVLPFDYCFKLLYWFHFWTTCRLVARLCYDFDVNGETYTKLTTVNYFWCITQWTHQMVSTSR